MAPAKIQNKFCRRTALVLLAPIAIVVHIIMASSLTGISNALSEIRSVW